MTGDDGAQESGDAATGPARRRVRRAAVGWTLAVVAASLVDPAAILELLGASTTAAGAGGAAAFAVAHLVAYGVLAWLLVDGLGPDGSNAVLVTVAVATAAGVGVELLQAPVAARTASVNDALVNAVGAALGAGSRAAVGRLRRR
ncbi:VanZ family protein [Halobellus ruber]|uniref:VanZ family protein n=1 Tax=Halobellus ruber TaxID=2761102 RepID=A0A7J9SIB6_9EURY|nr:VanZ family protein [Halobellus ruber]MBB6646468.1 VanZ family protein [Halobellus ruber]